VAEQRKAAHIMASRKEIETGRERERDRGGKERKKERVCLHQGLSPFILPGPPACGMCTHIQDGSSCLS
jgi:hypothetical protein